MDVFCDSHDIAARFEPYVIDLQRLFVFHGIPCGSAAGFVALGRKLEESKALRLDLPALLRNIRDLEAGRITADEMLTILALACGGPDLVDGRAETVGLPRIVSLLRVMLAGVGSWSAMDEPRPVPTVALGAPAPPLASPALELSLEQLRRQLSDIDSRLHRLEPAPTPAGKAPPDTLHPATPIPPAAAPPTNLKPVTDPIPWQPASAPEEPASVKPAFLTNPVGPAPKISRRLPLWGRHAVISAPSATYGPRSRRYTAVAAAVVAVSLAAWGALRLVHTEPTPVILAQTSPPEAKAMPVPSARTTPAVDPGTPPPPVLQASLVPSLHVTTAAAPLPSPAKKLSVAALTATPDKARVEDRPSASGGPLQVPSAVMDRHLLSARKPIFPQAARTQRLEGTVVLNAYVGRDGSVTRMDVISGPAVFIDSAMAAVSWRRYKPYLLHGRPVQVVTPVAVSYHSP